MDEWNVWYAWYRPSQKDGFIETVAGKGTFVSAQNKDFIKEEQLRIIEEKIEDIVKIAKIYDVSLENMIKTLTVIYEEE